LTAAFVVVVLAALVVGWFRTEDLTARWIVAVFFSFCVLAFAYATLHDWRQARRLRQVLHGREPLTPEAFGAMYFSDLARGPEVASCLRHLLDEHLERDLGGLRPDDALDCLEDWIDPLFVDELADRLGFAPPADWDEFSEFMRPVRTVSDLIEAIARRAVKPPATNGTTT
jgi:hypothetical protein